MLEDVREQRPNTEPLQFLKTGKLVELVVDVCSHRLEVGILLGSP